MSQSITADNGKNLLIIILGVLLLIGIIIGIIIYANAITADGTMIIDAGGAFVNRRLIRNDGTIVNNGTYTIGDSWGGVLYN
ncbi:MAG: hypothetical protein K6G57_09010 [Lachnospiraceae bacterium]|nr:hypothetical protein [Lachnospiraceae bacterium]